MKINQKTILDAITLLKKERSEIGEFTQKIEQNSEEFMNLIRLNFISSKCNGYVSGYYYGIPIIENHDITKGEVYLIGYNGEILQTFSFEK